MILNKVGILTIKKNHNLNLESNDFIILYNDNFKTVSMYSYDPSKVNIDEIEKSEYFISNRICDAFHIKNNLYDFFNIVKNVYHYNNVSLLEKYGISSIWGTLFIIEDYEKFNLFILKYSEYL